MTGRIGPYELISELGRGGMGEVYLANDTRLDRAMAIKALPEDKRDRRWVVSQGIGHLPLWSPEGDELFFVDQDGRLMGVDVENTGDSIAFSAPRMMFQTPWDVGRNYDVFPEGVGRDNHFAFVDATSENDTRIHVVLNWQTLLKDD